MLWPLLHPSAQQCHTHWHSKRHPHIDSNHRHAGRVWFRPAHRIVNYQRHLYARVGRQTDRCPMQLTPIHPDLLPVSPPPLGRGSRPLRPPRVLPFLRDGDLLHAARAARLQPAAADADEHPAALPADALLPPLPVAAQGEGAGAAVHPVRQLAAAGRAGAGHQAAAALGPADAAHARARAGSTRRRCPSSGAPSGSCGRCGG